MAIQFVNNLELNQNSLDNAVIQNIGGANPVAGKLGQIIFNTGAGELRVCTTAQVVGVSNAVYSAVGGGVVTLTMNDGTFIDVNSTGTAANPIFAPDLSATGTPSADNFLSGDNTWKAVPGGYTSWTAGATTGTPNTILTGDTVSWSGSQGISTEITTVGTTSTVKIELDDTLVTPASYTNASITVDQQGRLTAASSGTAPVTPSNATITLTGGNGLANAGGAFTLDQAANEEITFNVGAGAGMLSNANDVAIDYTSTGIIDDANDGTSVTLVDADEFLFEDVSSAAATAVKRGTLSQLKTYMPNTDTNYDLSKAAGSTNLILKADGTAQDTIQFTGTTNEIEVSGVTADVYKFGLPDSVTISTKLTVSGTGTDSINTAGKATSAATTGTDAATTLTTKGYVDGLVSGGLTFKGTFNANSGEILSGDNDGSFLYNNPGGAGTRVAVALGDYYVVATAGNFYVDTTVPVDVGDAIIGVEVAAADTSVIGDWSTISQGVTVNSFTNANGTYVSAATANTNATGAVTTGVIDLSAVDGTSDVNTKFLSKDNTWDVPSYTTNTDANYELKASAKTGSTIPILLDGTNGGSDSTVNLTEGANITLTRNSATQITIAATDTGALGKRIDLDSTDAWVTRTVSGGLTTFAVTVTNANVFGAGTAALDVKCEVLSAAGQTVYADVTRSGAVISIEFTGTIADSAFQTLLTYVG
jgi:fibronectin-binding autotransporter adhesin